MMDRTIGKQSRVKLLSKSLRDKVRSGCTIVSLAQCVQELVYNSIDAGAKDIYVGININKFSVNVEDDGCGMSLGDLKLLGKRYFTSKCSSEDDLKNPVYYGYKGEALASIISVSNYARFDTVDENGVAYRRVFRDGKSSGEIRCVEWKKSKRFCVSVEGVLGTQPVRQKRMDLSLQLEEVKIVLENIVLINPNVRVEFRNERDMSIMLNYDKCFSNEDAFDQLFSAKRKQHFEFFTENHLQDGLLLTASIGRQMFRMKCYQYVFVNRRCIEARGRIHKTMNDALIKILTIPNDEKEKTTRSDKIFPVFILNITCGIDKYCPQRDSKYSVEFLDWESCLKGLEGLILKIQRRIDPSASSVDVFIPKAKERLSQQLMGFDKKKKNLRDLCTPVTDSPHVSVDKTFGRNLSVRDVKRAVHSKLVRRKSPTRPLTTGSTNFHGITLSDEEDSPEASNGCSISYSALADSPSLERPFNIHSGGAIGLSKTSKHVIYNVRRSPKQKETKRDKQKTGPGVAKPRRDIVVSKTKEPCINKDIFSQFPQWRANKRPQKHLQPMSPPPLKRLRFEKLGYRPKDKLPFKGKRFDFPNYEFPRQRNSVQETLNAINREASGSFDWKMKRFIEEIKKADEKKNSKVSSSRVSLEDSVDSPVRSNEVPMSQNDTILSSYAESKKASILLSSSRNPKYKTTPGDSISNRVVLSDEDFANLCVNAIEESSKYFVKTKNLDSLFDDIAKFLRNDDQEVQKRLLQEKLNTSQMMDDSNAMDPLNQDYLPVICPLKSLRLESQPLGGAMAQSNLISLFGCSSSQMPNCDEEINVCKQDATISSYWPFGSNDQTEATPSLEEIPFNTMQTQHNSTEIHHINNNNVECDNNAILDVEEDFSPYFCEAFFAPFYTPPAPSPSRRRGNWLRRYFPKNCDKLWKQDQSSKPSLNGELHSTANYLGSDVRDCIAKSSEHPIDMLDKWRKEALDAAFGYDTNAGKNPCEEEETVSKFFPGTFKAKNNLTTSSMKFCKEDLNHITVVSQWDRKFIIAKLNLFGCNDSTQSKTTGKQILVVLDQHAVDERIRLENLVREAHEDKNTAKPLLAHQVDPAWKLTLTETEVRVVYQYKTAFQFRGIDANPINSTTILCHTIPLCLVERAYDMPVSSRRSFITKILNTLICEEVQKILETKSVQNCMPKCIYTMLTSKACHGAIKFGDVLDIETCEKLISELKDCNTPFQCAHGRPSMIPLVDLSSIFEKSVVG